MAESRPFQSSENESAIERIDAFRSMKNGFVELHRMVGTDYEASARIFPNRKASARSKFATEKRIAFENRVSERTGSGIFNRRRRERIEIVRKRSRVLDGRVLYAASERAGIFKPGVRPGVIGKLSRSFFHVSRIPIFSFVSVQRVLEMGETGGLSRETQIGNPDVAFDSRKPELRSRNVRP